MEYCTEIFNTSVFLTLLDEQQDKELYQNFTRVYFWPKLKQ